MPAKSESQKKLFNIALGMKRGDIPKTNTPAGKISESMKESKIKEFTKSNKVDPEDNDNYEYGNGGEVELKPENRIDATEYKYGRKGEVPNFKLKKQIDSFIEKTLNDPYRRHWIGGGHSTTSSAMRGKGSTQERALEAREAINRLPKSQRPLTIDDLKDTPTRAGEMKRITSSSGKYPKADAAVKRQRYEASHMNKSTSERIDNFIEKAQQGSSILGGYNTAPKRRKGQAFGNYAAERDEYLSSLKKPNIKEAKKVFSDPTLQKVHEEGGISPLKKSSYHPLHQQSFKNHELAGRKLSNLGAKHQKTLTRASGNITRVYNHPQHGVFTTVDSGKKTKIFHYPMHKSVEDFMQKHREGPEGHTHPDSYYEKKYNPNNEYSRGIPPIKKKPSAEPIWRNKSGMQKSVESDLKQSKKEEDKAILDYDKRAERAESEGDKDAANMFRELSRDETHHATQLEEKLVKDINNFIEKTVSKHGYSEANERRKLAGSTSLRTAINRQNIKDTKRDGLYRPEYPKDYKGPDIEKNKQFSFGGKQNRPPKSAGSSVERQVEAGKASQPKTNWNSFLGGRAAERPGSRLPKSGERTYKSVSSHGYSESNERRKLAGSESIKTVLDRQNKARKLKSAGNKLVQSGKVPGYGKDNPYYKSKDDKLANYVRKDPVTRSMNRNIDKTRKLQNKNNAEATKKDKLFRPEYPKGYKGPDLINSIDNFIEKHMSANDISMAEHHKNAKDLKSEARKLREKTKEQVKGILES